MKSLKLDPKLEFDFFCFHIFILKTEDDHGSGQNGTNK